MLNIALNRVPRWDGQTVVCLASGPSLTTADAEVVRQRVGDTVKVIVVNATYRMAHWADVCYAADYRFWRTYFKDVRKSFSGEMWTMSSQASKEFGINCIGRANCEGYSPLKHTISTGGNSGYQALHLAAYWGASRVVLLGYDMQRSAGRSHWHGDHEGNLPNGHRGFDLWIRRFAPLARDLRKFGIQVLNCTRSTALECFPRVRLEEVAW